MEAMIETKPTLEELIAELYTLRNQRALLVLEKNRIQIAFDAENADLIVQTSGTTEAIAALESIIKAEAVGVFETTGNKTPTAGVNVKEITGYEYDAEVALGWAKEHKMALIKAFSSICKAETTRPNFVEVKTTPRAEIATDLRNAVGEATI